MSSTTLRPALVAAVLGTVVLSGCAGKSPSSSAPSPSVTSVPVASPTAAASVAASSSPAASPTALAVDQTIHITYANGKVSGVPARVKVKHNARVALVVTSDVADEVHFHGYNKMADVAKGGTVTIVFKASLQGEFEVELEKLKHRLVLLQIQ
jgi:hypothetical protein